jgi:hypothetical protein
MVMKMLLTIALLAAGFIYGPARAEGNNMPPATEPAKSTPVVADLAEGQKAQQALDELIQAYETGNTGLIRSRLDPAMIGYQRFIDGVIEDNNRLKLIRIHLSDVQVLAGPDIAVIQANWEKRFLSANGLQPDLNSGHSMFLLHRDQGQWRVAAFGGDNLFASQSGVLAQLSMVYNAGPATMSITVVDPDIAGTGSITVQMIYGNPASSHSVSLIESTPGRFSRNVEVGATPGAVILKYVDNNPGGGRPPSVLTKSVMIP